jgi:hypothetical protein
MTVRTQFDLGAFKHAVTERGVKTTVQAWD